MNHEGHSFGDVLPCRMVDRYQHSEGMCCVPLQVRRVEMLAPLYWTVWHYPLGNCNLHIDCHDNPKSHVMNHIINCIICRMLWIVMLCIDGRWFQHLRNPLLKFSLSWRLMLSVCVFRTKTGFMCVTFTSYTLCQREGKLVKCYKISLRPLTKQPNV